MEFKVLAVGDVVGGPGMERIRRNLRRLKRETKADFVIVNGENAAVVGITPDQAEDILDAGADVITLGNHTWMTAAAFCGRQIMLPRYPAGAGPFMKPGPEMWRLLI